MKAKKIDKNVYWLGLLSFFNDVTSDMILPLLPAYLGAMGLGATFLGVMEGFAEAISNVTKLFSGWLSDRTGKTKNLTVAGYALSSVVRFFIAVPLPAVVLAARLVDRIGKGIRTAPRDRIITNSVDPKQWGRAFGIQRAMDHAGAIVGPLIATWILSAYGWSYSKLFLVACIPAVVSILIVPFFVKVPKTPAAETAKAPVHPLGSWKALPTALKRYVIIIFCAAFCTPSELFLLMRMKDQGLDASRLPLAWLVMTVATFFAAYLGGRLSDAWSRRRTIGLGWLLFAAVYASFAFNETLAVSWGLLAVYGFQMGLVEPAERAYSALVAPEQMRATALGWFYLAYGLGLLPASVLFGVVWDAWGAKPAFLINATLTILTVCSLFFLPSDRKKRLLPSGSEEG